MTDDAKTKLDPDAIVVSEKLKSMHRLQLFGIF